MKMEMTENKKNALFLVARIIIGGIFIAEGGLKIYDMTGTVAFFATLGVPAFLAYAVGYVELIGGVFILLGLWTYLATTALALVMIGAIWLTRSGGFQAVLAPLAILTSLILIMASGAGKYAVCLKKKMGDSTVA